MPVLPVILLIDHDDKSRELIANTLRKDQFEVVEWNNAESLDAISRVDCCLVMVDLETPGTNGIDIVHHLKQHPLTACVPIIICTASNDESDIIGGLDAGADDYIIKPFMPMALAARVKAVMRRHNVGR